MTKPDEIQVWVTVSATVRTRPWESAKIEIGSSLPATVGTITQVRKDLCARLIKEVNVHSMKLRELHKPHFEE